MFGAISKLFRKSERATPVSSSPFAQPDARGAAPQSPPVVPTPPRNEAPVVTPLPKSSGKRASGDVLSVPYASIIRLIPQELWGKLAPAGVAGYNFSVSRRTVLEQIPHGAVKVSFAELRRGAPAGVFVAGSDQDSRMLDLPLAEILGQLHPDAFARRPNQVRIQISDEVPDLFGAKGERLANVRVLEKKGGRDTSHTTSHVRQKVPAPAPTVPITPVPIPANITPLPVPEPPAPSHAPIPAPNLRMPTVPSATPRLPAAAPIAMPRINAPVPASPARPLPKAPAPIAPANPPTPVVPIQTASPSMVAAANALGFGSQAFLVSLDHIASAWPSGIRQELAQVKIPDAKLAFPPVEICEGLKRGRIQYPWRVLRSWLQPTPIYATPSPHDELMIELPLKTLTPLFLEFIRANTSDRTVASAEGITEFFRRAEAFSGTSAEPIRMIEPRGQPVPAPIVHPNPASPAAFAPVPMAPVSPPAAAVIDAGDASPPAVAAIENGKLCLPVSQICSTWPEAIVRDIQQFGLGSCRLEVPVELIMPGLKSGRVEFLWKELSAWLNPSSRAAQVSINGETRLPLPLNVVAPLFLRQREAQGAKKRVTVAESIPDVFSAAGKPVVASSAASVQSVEPEAPATPAAPAPAPAPAAAPVEAAPRKLPTSVAELFGEPDKKSWTPNEIVQRTTSLPNVAGSLIAMQDGLLVAHFMPPTVKTETIAAFVPQIFGRLNQYCKELQMGEAEAVSFTVGAGTVHVFNAGIIYFAALSKPGELLPLPELHLIASELSRHTK